MLVGRSRQHPHRRGPHAAYHQRTPGRRRKSSEAEAYRWGRPKTRATSPKMITTNTTTKKKTVELTLPRPPQSPRIKKTRSPWTACRSLRFTNTSNGQSKSHAENDFSNVSTVVRDGEIVIVDEFTGRLGEGPQVARRHPPGPSKPRKASKSRFATNQAARITVQDFFPSLQSPRWHDGHRLPQAPGELYKIYSTRVPPRPDQQTTYP